MEEGITDATHCLFFFEDAHHVDGVSTSLNNSARYELRARGDGTLEASKYDVQVDEPATAVGCRVETEVCAKLMEEGGNTDRGGVGYEVEGSTFKVGVLRERGWSRASIWECQVPPRHLSLTTAFLLCRAVSLRIHGEVYVVPRDSLWQINRLMVRIRTARQLYQFQETAMKEIKATQ